MGTKIVVIKMKELIKKAVFIIIGIVVIGVLIYFFVPKGGKNQAMYEPGTYSAQIILHNSPVRVDVTVNESEIIDIQMTELGQTQEVFYPLLRPTADELALEIIEKQSVDIEASADKSMTTKIFLDAVNKALENAKGKDGKNNETQGSSESTTAQEETEETSK